MSALLLALLALAPAAQERGDDPLRDELEERSWELLETSACPGLAVARVLDGELAWAFGAGYADLDTERLVTPETVFNIGSISKTLAAWGLMRLVERGELELDAPALPGLAERWSLPSSSFDPSGVTLRRLLSHTAGLTLHGYPGYLDAAELPTIEASLSGESNAGELVLFQEPGAGWKYSGGGYTIAQLLYETATSGDFAEGMRAEVFLPLGMVDTDYRWTEAIRAKASRAYEEGEPLPGGPYFAALAAAGCQTTAVDLARFCVASLAARGGEWEAKARGVLTAATVAAMQEPQPASPGYGLGYQLQDAGDGVRLVGHGGANQGWMAQVWIAPDHGDAIVILTNATEGRALHGPIQEAWMRDLRRRAGLGG